MKQTLEERMKIIETQSKIAPMPEDLARKTIADARTAVGDKGPLQLWEPQNTVVARAVLAQWTSGKEMKEKVVEWNKLLPPCRKERWRTMLRYANQLWWIKGKSRQRAASRINWMLEKRQLPSLKRFEVAVPMDLPRRQWSLVRKLVEKMMHKTSHDQELHHASHGLCERPDAEAPRQVEHGCDGNAE